MAKDPDPDRDSATEAIAEAARHWKASKKAERRARDAFADVVREVVSSGHLSENKVAGLTNVPRMTIRKMLGKSGT